MDFGAILGSKIDPNAKSSREIPSDLLEFLYENRKKLTETLLGLPPYRVQEVFEPILAAF